MDGMLTSQLITIDSEWDGKRCDDFNGQQKQKQHPYSIKFVLLSNMDIIIEVDAPFYNDPPPPSIPSSLSSSLYKYEHLYQHEVVEIFLSSFCDNDKDNDNDSSSPTDTSRPYLEVQLGPHGHYMIVYFTNEGDFANQDLGIELDTLPLTTIDHSSSRWHSRLILPNYLLPDSITVTTADDLDQSGVACHMWSMNAFAIHNRFPNEHQHQSKKDPSPSPLSSLNERIYLSYIKLDGDAPNFHQLKHFSPLRLVPFDGDQHGNGCSDDGSSDLLVDLIIINAADAFGLSDNKVLVEGEEDEVAVEEEEEEEESASKVDTFIDSSSVIHISSSASCRHASDVSLVAVTASIYEGEEGSHTDHHRSELEKIASYVREESMQLGIVDLGKLFARLLQPLEYCVLHSIVTKRKDWSYRTRKLILTNRMRLFYTDMQGNYKGCVPWSLMKLISTNKISDVKFQITVHDSSRVYHIRLHDAYVDHWIRSIDLFNLTQTEYLKKMKK